MHRELEREAREAALLLCVFFVALRGSLRPLSFSMSMTLDTGPRFFASTTVPFFVAKGLHFWSLRPLFFLSPTFFFVVGRP